MVSLIIPPHNKIIGSIGAAILGKEHIEKIIIKTTLKGDCNKRPFAPLFTTEALIFFI